MYVTVEVNPMAHQVVYVFFCKIRALCGLIANIQIFNEHIFMFDLNSYFANL